MQAHWTIAGADVLAVQALVAQYAGAPLVVSRQASVNVAAQKCTQSEFWDALVAAVLSSQQKWETVETFLASAPLPLSTAQGNNFHAVAVAALEAGGQRFPAKWARALTRNVAWLDRKDANGRDGWKEMSDQVGRLVNAWGLAAPAAITAERSGARWASSIFESIGPKQSRNIWQMLGLSRFEIPIDSRVTRWLNSLGCAPMLTPAMLADGTTYEWTLDAIQDICSRAGVLPCIFDAAVFAHYG